MNPMNGSDFSRTREQLEPDFDPYGTEVGELPQGGGAPDDATTKTGTTIVGLVTEDSVVMGSDQRASLAGRIVSNKDVQKVERIQQNAALTISGSVGGAQAFIRALRAETNLYEARRGEEMSISALATMASNMLRGGPYFRVVPLLGGVDDDGGHVFSLDPAGSRLADDYSTSGSGMQYAMGVLEQEYTTDLSTDEAKTVAARAVKSAVERDTASGNGIHLTTVTRNDVTTEGYESFEDLV